MGLSLFLLFIVLPLLEIYVLITVGGAIGALTTIGLVILTAVVGSTLVRSQGLPLWRQINQQLQSGRLPAFALWHGVLLLVAGCLLLTPGFITDSLGLLLLIPTFRMYLLSTLIRWYLQKKFAKGIRVLDGEFKVL